MNEKEKREKTIQYCLEEAIKIKPFRHHIGNKNLSEFDMSKIGG
jgi:hypothetical protein